jgi:hypothetical protein
LETHLSQDRQHPAQVLGSRVQSPVTERAARQGDVQLLGRQRTLECGLPQPLLFPGKGSLEGHLHLVRSLTNRRALLLREGSE